VDHHRKAVLVRQVEDAVEAIVGDLEILASRVQLQADGSCTQAALCFEDRIVARIEPTERVQQIRVRLRELYDLFVCRAVAPRLL
jgi:hypothetical protein